MKRLRFIAVLLAAAFALSGCNLVKINPERDAAQIVATVNDENITKKQVYDVSGLTWDQKIPSWQEAEVLQLKEQALESLVNSAVLKQKAKALGFYNFNADDQKKIDDDVNAITKSIYDAALKDFQEKAKEDSSINPEEKAKQAVTDYLAVQGVTLDELKQQYSDSLVLDKLKKSVTDPIKSTDADTKTGYDTKLAEQKTAYDKEPSTLVSDDLNGATILYYPIDGIVRVKHILIKLDDVTSSDIAKLRTDGKTAEADTMRTEALKTIETKAQDALAKAKAASGNLTTLDQLVKDIGEDPGLTARTAGYPTFKDYVGYEANFQKTAMELKDIGVPSELVASDYGYHIIWLTDKPAKGAVAFDTVKAQIAEDVLAELQDKAWQETATQWKSEAKITTYPRRLDN